MPLTERTLFFPVIRLITNPLVAMRAIHNSYGDTVPVKFFNKRLLFVAKPEYIELILSQEAKGNINRDGLYHAKKTVFRDGLVNSKGEVWQNQRRIMQPFFSKESVSRWHGLMLGEIDQVIQQIKQDKPDTLNITQCMKALVQNIVARILFGEAVNAHEKQILITHIDTIFKGILPQISADLFGKSWIKYLYMMDHKAFLSAVEQFNQFVSDKIQQLKSNNTGLIGELHNAQDPKTGYVIPEELLKDEAINLFIAGQDTTINTLIWFFYHIGKDNVIQEKLHEEITTYKTEDLSQNNLGKYTYTKAVLQEILRLYPPAKALNRHPVDDKFDLDGYAVPQDTAVLVNIYATHYSPKLWEQPESFYPEHFFNPELASKRHRHAHLPFGAGIHNCIGRHLAELEMMLIIISLLREFSFHIEMTAKAAVSITLKPDKDVIAKLKLMRK